jgi:hypothetical protein
MKNRMLVEFTLCKSFGLKPNLIYLSAIDVQGLCSKFPITREFSAFTREFGTFTREFPPFTREFGAFTREFGLYS